MTSTPTRPNLDTLTLADHGAQLFRGAALDDLPALLDVLAPLPAEQAGSRISDMPGLRPFLAPTGCIGMVASRALGDEGKAVRAILFDKSAGTNWSLAWHQDRTICVAERVEVEGFGPWSVKAGLHHVAPPFDLLARMVTLRVHLDDVPATNAPLLIAPGSHRHGRVPVDAVEGLAARCGTMACLASAGDVWAYSTPILHASEAASRPARRRVLQVDFSADALLGGLEWLGV
ncbi:MULTISPECIES: phytanoyl-CoA dioxygenase family protein [unclassified Novosphingobium]|uniref:phytanoyl-CoA dioxygenase family protein n=2 Tax=Novosphingobium TaxID=165696 RepID=UPI00086CF84D|nr:MULTISPECIES: phytanoyl-CoA dioxygenase family protein [unclassified Novosphingobium]MBN9142739.1 phytanoyl-CoA dioxygenase family protein [Novosphingobium sp.]MDR6705823.1 ectoine hydroxylase-related dioxygenase (phytanoyl-CoA dioxygenase family) [Novosphingobium sp. 1748]ODU85087.1 MAG: phytanoyl-CoA dioxygenase [Novosphingobium sp. SCN 63-17]OJX89136.1 MAG: phytanoyl-CoA dioxygenase [Novosphingobium sp. 63-713]